MKIHTTQAGDQFLIDHIQSTTKWSQRNHRRPVNFARVFTYGCSLALVIIIFLTVLITAH